MREMSPAATAKKRLGVVGGGGFALGCGCKDAKAVAVAASSASPYSTEASTATSATWRRLRAAYPSASGSTGTLTVPSASSSSFPWEDAEVDGGGEEVNCKPESAADTPSFSGLLKQLNELEQNVVSLGRKSTSKQSCLSPPPPPLPSRPVAKQRALHSGDRHDIEEGHGNFSPPPPPPLPSRPVAKQRAVHSGDMHDIEEGHGNLSPPPPPPPPPPSFQFQAQQHRKAKSMDKGDRQDLAALLRQPPPPSLPEQSRNTKSTDKGDRQELAALLRQPPPPSSPEQPRNTKSTDKGSNQKEDVNSFPVPQQQAPKHRKAKSLDGTVAVVKQSDDPLSDFRRSMVNMIVENRIVTGDELRELLRHFLALNAPHHHGAILRAFTEIWDEAFSTKAQHRESSARTTPPRQRAPPPQRRLRHPTRAWR